MPVPCDDTNPLIMKRNFQRSILFNVSPLQERLLLPFYLTALLLCVCLGYFDYLLIQEPFFTHKEKSMVLIGLSLLLSLGLVFLIWWAYVISNKVLGPHQRIISELDNILSGGKKKPLNTRRGDEMYEDLIKRINVLIEGFKVEKK